MFQVLQAASPSLVQLFQHITSLLLGQPTAYVGQSDVVLMARGPRAFCRVSHVRSDRICILTCKVASEHWTLQKFADTMQDWHEGLERVHREATVVNSSGSVQASQPPGDLFLKTVHAMSVCAVGVNASCSRIVRQRVQQIVRMTDCVNKRRLTIGIKGTAKQCLKLSISCAHE